MQYRPMAGTGRGRFSLHSGIVMPGYPPSRPLSAAPPPTAAFVGTTAVPGRSTISPRGELGHRHHPIVLLAHRCGGAVIAKFPR